MWFTRRVRDERGAAMVELGFALPVLLLLVWGVIDFTRLLVTSNSLTTAVREGARFAAVLQSPSANTAAIKTAVKNAFTPLGNPALTDAQIVVLDSTASKGNVTVQIQNYAANSITPLSVVIGSSISFNRQATFRWEQAAAP